MGLTGRTRADATLVAEDVGRATQPGRHLVIVDQLAPDDQDPRWDVAEEGTALAHELLHNLGVPHNVHDHFVMSEQKRTSVHVLAPSTRQLALTSGLARFAHWDPVVALTSLSHSAERYLDEPVDQLDYITENLALGLGVPRPTDVAHTRISALATQALGTYWRAAPSPAARPPQAPRCGALDDCPSR